MRVVSGDEVAQSLRNHIDVHAVLIGRAGPRVTRHVSSERPCKARHATDTLEQPVVIAQGGAVAARRLCHRGTGASIGNTYGLDEVS